MCVYTAGAVVLQDDAVSIRAGRDFSLMTTHSGKVFCVIGLVLLCDCLDTVTVITTDYLKPFLR